MDIERFQNSSAGKTVQVGQGETAYWAFVPDPLPPKLQFTTKLVEHLSKADRALGELSGLGRSICNPQLLVGPFIHREAVLSSRIEGTRADIGHFCMFVQFDLSELKTCTIWLPSRVPILVQK